MYFYELNFCRGSKEHRFDDEAIREKELAMFNGKFDNFYETNTYESFLKYNVGQNHENDQACQRQLTSAQYDDF